MAAWVTALLMSASWAAAAPPVSSIGSAWNPIFFDEFEGSALDAQRWTARSGCTPFCTAADTVAVSGGVLRLANRAATPADGATGAWVGAELVSRAAFGDGYYEVVLQPPASTGLTTAALLAPVDGPAAQRWEIYLAEVFQPAGAGADQWSARQRGIDWTLPTATAQVPWIGGISPPPSATFNFSAAPATFGLYRTAAGDLAWYRNDVMTASEVLPWTVGANVDLAVHLRMAAAAYAGDATGSAGAVAQVHAFRYYRLSDTPVLYEPFAYPAGTIDAQNTGLGFASAWTVNPPNGAVTTGDGTSLPYPLASPAVGAGGTLQITNATAQRTLALNVKLSELNAFFFSALVRKPDSATIRFELLDNLGNVRWRMGLDAQERAIAGIVTDATGAVGVPVVDQPVALVSMMAARAGTAEDEIRAKVFGTASTIPSRAFDIAAFDVMQKQLSQVTLTTLRITAVGGPVAVDELRFGPTLASVTSVRAAGGDCPGPPDFIDDDVLDLRDAAAFLALFEAQSAAADLNADGRTDLRDYAEFTLAVSHGCP